MKFAAFLVENKTNSSIICVLNSLDGFDNYISQISYTYLEKGGKEFITSEEFIELGQCISSFALTAAKK